MMAFEISVNGRHVATIGIGGVGMLTAAVGWGQAPGGLSHVPRLTGGGLDILRNEQVRWAMPEIALGDEVTIKVVESDEITPEAVRRPAKRTETRP